MLFGVDTSGKIGEGNIYIAVVEHRNTDFMPLLRDVVRKRHRALAERRRIKASELTENELGWISRSFDSGYSASFIGINTFSGVRGRMMAFKNWKLKVLASAIFLTCPRSLKNEDVILVDRDYSENVMSDVFRYMRLLFEINGKKPIIEAGTSFNEVIAKADLIAGCARRGKVKTRELKEKDIMETARIFKK